MFWFNISCNKLFNPIPQYCWSTNSYIMYHDGHILIMDYVIIWFIFAALIGVFVSTLASWSYNYIKLYRNAFEHNDCYGVDKGNQGYDIEPGLRHPAHYFIAILHLKLKLRIRNTWYPYPFIVPAPPHEQTQQIKGEQCGYRHHQPNVCVEWTSEGSTNSECDGDGYVLEIPEKEEGLDILI
jgi:hypothetical protein